MPAPDELQPRVPGQTNDASQQPDDAAPDELQELVNLSAADLVQGLAALDDSELENLAALERETKARKTVLQAIDAELARRDAEAAASEPPLPAPKPRAPLDPKRPVLTEDGWVVPRTVPSEGAR